MKKRVANRTVTKIHAKRGFQIGQWALFDPTGRELYRHMKRPPYPLIDTGDTYHLSWTLIVTKGKCAT